MKKVWFGKKFSASGTVYTRFVSMTQTEALEAMKNVRGDNLVCMNPNDQIHAKQPIIVEGKYIFLNLTQFSYMLNMGNMGYNTAIYLTDRKSEKQSIPFEINLGVK
jgi:hypothetical protein